MFPRRTAALLLLTVAACSSGSSKATKLSASPSPTPSATPTIPAATPLSVRTSLRNIANAEETYFTDNVKYLAFIGKAPADLYDIGPIPAGAKVGVTLIGKDGFCAVEAVGTKFIAYDSTKGGIISTTVKAADYSQPCLTLVRTLTK